MSISIYHLEYNQTTSQTTKTSLSIDSISVRGLTSEGLNVDSILYNNQKKINKLEFPLNKFVPESKFVVTFNNTKDTITILHQNINEFLSLECGCLKVHSIDTVLTTNHYVDSVKIINHNVNTISTEHLQIYN
ncbi:MAG: DUF6452 family protein [Paludibacter sp.]